MYGLRKEILYGDLEDGQLLAEICSNALTSSWPV
jgi:hypothetical protein